MRVAIVDDEILFAQRVQEITRQYFESRKIEYEAVVCQTPQELLWDIEEGQYFDIYLIDIEMPDVSGMGASDAVYMLESRGLKTVVKGRGKVKSQSIAAGSVIKKGQICEIIME